MYDIDVFRDLCVDPVDTINFGISCNNQFYVDLSVAFGWMHGSAVFQMTSDAIAFMLKDLGCKVHAYFDNYMVVAPRGRAFVRIWAFP